jgi:hypothetical protein
MPTDKLSPVAPNRRDWERYGDDMSVRTNSGQTAPASADSYYDEPVAGAGWLFFSGTVLGLAGLMRVIDSIWAFSYKGALPDNLKDGVLGSNLKNYAWLWLIVGVVLLICSFAVLTRNQFARWVGIIGGAIGAISAIAWMPYYPVWSLVYIGLGVGVIYGLSVYGSREPA